MIASLIGIAIIAVITIFWTAFFGLVYELPYGLDPILVLFNNQVQLVIHILPPLATVWNVFIIGLHVKVLLFVMNRVQWIIGIIRG